MTQKETFWKIHDCNTIIIISERHFYNRILRDIGSLGSVDGYTPGMVEIISEFYGLGTSWNLNGSYVRSFITFLIKAILSYGRTGLFGVHFEGFREILCQILSITSRILHQMVLSNLFSRCWDLRLSSLENRVLVWHCGYVVFVLYVILMATSRILLVIPWRSSYLMLLMLYFSRRVHLMAWRNPKFDIPEIVTMRKE